jgi:hypothetical protein
MSGASSARFAQGWRETLRDRAEREEMLAREADADPVGAMARRVCDFAITTDAAVRSLCEELGAATADGRQVIANMLETAIRNRLRSTRCATPSHDGRWLCAGDPFHTVSHCWSVRLP